MLICESAEPTLICIYILLLIDGVSQHFNNQKNKTTTKIQTCFHLHLTLEGLGADQQANVLSQR